MKTLFIFISVIVPVIIFIGVVFSVLRKSMTTIPVEMSVTENTWFKKDFEKIKSVSPNIRSIFRFGWGNGYVHLPKGHPFYNVHYDHLWPHVTIHGGLTFSNLNNDDYPGMWTLGFDTCHYLDNEVNCNRDYVVFQTEFLKKQMERIHAGSRKPILICTKKLTIDHEKLGTLIRKSTVPHFC